MRVLGFRKGDWRLLKAKVLGSDFFGQFLVLASGGGIALLLPVLLTPILARLYSPKSYGIFAFYMGLVGFMGMMASGRYELAIVLPKKESEGKSLLMSCLAITAAISVVLLLFGFLSGDWIAGRMGIVGGGIVFLWASPAVFLIGAYNSFSYWLLRQGDFRSLSFARILQAGSQVVFQALASKWGASGLMAGQVFGFSIGVIWMLLRSGEWWRDCSPWLKVLKKYRNFPRYNLPHAFLDGVRANGVSMLLTMFFTSADLGFYYLASKVFAAPAMVFGGAVSQIYYQRSARRIRERQSIWGLTWKLSVLLAVIGVPFLGLVVFGGGELFALVFGRQWRQAGEFARILSPYMFLNFIASALSQLPLTLQKQKENLLWGIGASVLIVGSILLGGIFLKQMTKTLVLQSGVMTLYSAALLGWFLLIARQGARGTTPLPSREEDV